MLYLDFQDFDKSWMLLNYYSIEFNISLPLSLSLPLPLPLPLPLSLSLHFTDIKEYRGNLPAVTIMFD